MGSQPTRPRTAGEEVDNETKRILSERDKTFDRDKITARDAREVIAEARRRLKRRGPR